MAGFRRIRTNELNDIEKALVMALRVGRRKTLKTFGEDYDGYDLWRAVIKEFNENLARLIHENPEKYEAYARGIGL